MANHAGRAAQVQQPQPPPKQTPPPPRIEWGQIQRVGDMYHLVTMVTQGDKILEQRVGEGNTWRPVAEALFQRWACDAVLDRNDDP